MGLIGRAAELELVTARLRDRRLVTLIGPGGIGKTTLAKAAVERCAGDYGEGSRLVDLTRVESAESVRESLAAQLGYASFRALIDAPGDHSVLILVDNCEHVVDAVADAVEQLLDACQMPTVVATSRMPLELPGEVVVPVGPLELPPLGGVDAPSVQLFVERARDAGVDVEPSDVVAELCRRLDGVPLAIELAAARARSMAPAEILDRLVAGLDVLDRPRRRVARRHQSLRAAVRWSYDLLDGAERDLFDHLGVFPGPFTAELAHAVAGADGSSPAATADVLDRLVAASMVVADTAGEVTWYRELETLRAFAREHLDERGERVAAEARFVDHVVARVASIVTSGAASWSASSLGELLALYDSVAAALRWSIQHDDEPDRAFLLVAALWGVIHQAHTDEIGALAEAVLERWPASAHPLRADAAATAATCAYMRGDHDRAVSLATGALDGAAASPYAPATLRRALAQSRRATGDVDGALRWFAEAAGEARRLGLPALAIEADAARAQVLADVGRIEEAVALVGDALDGARSIGAEVPAAWAATVQGSVLLRVDVDEAVRVLDGAVRGSRRLGYAAGVDAGLRCLAFAELLRGDVRAGARRVLELLDHLIDRGSTNELRLVFDAASAVLAAAGRAQPAADLAATALALPVVSITASVGHELFPPDPTGGTVLSIRDGILATRAELGVLAAGADELPPTDRPEDARVGVFRRAGDYWEIGFAGELATVRTSKGMHDLATLLRAAGREVHCLELAGGGVDEAGTGPVLDDTARRAYEGRVRELQAELDDAEGDHDRGRAEKLRAELDAVVDELVSALGLSGRVRSSAGAAERARSAVTQRIRSTIRRLEGVHPRLGRHLAAAVRTGTFCSYVPEDPVRWQL